MNNAWTCGSLEGRIFYKGGISYQQKINDWEIANPQNLIGTHDSVVGRHLKLKQEYVMIMNEVLGEQV